MTLLIVDAANFPEDKSAIRKIEQVQRANQLHHRAGGAVKTRRSAGGGCGDGWHEKWISLMGDGHLGTQSDLVDRAGDTVPMVPRYTQHA